MTSGCSSSLVGTYVLSHRELPDGTTQRAPDIVGCMTYTDRYRQFHIRNEEPDGSILELMYVAEYSLTKDGYAERPLHYRVQNASGEVIEHDLDWSERAPVTREGDSLSFRLPLFAEPTVTFEGNQMIATDPGVFTDYWDKIE
jgi:hypothetical protein